MRAASYGRAAITKSSAPAQRTTIRTMPTRPGAADRISHTVAQTAESAAAAFHHDVLPGRRSRRPCLRAGFVRNARRRRARRRGSRQALRRNPRDPRRGQHLRRVGSRDDRARWLGGDGRPRGSEQSDHGRGRNRFQALLELSGPSRLAVHGLSRQGFALPGVSSGRDPGHDCTIQATIASAMWSCSLESRHCSSVLCLAVVCGARCPKACTATMSRNIRI